MPNESKGSLVGSIIVVIILIIGAIYFISSRGSKPTITPAPTPNASSTTPVVSNTPAPSLSTLQNEAAAIDLPTDADLNALNDALKTK